MCPAKELEETKEQTMASKPRTLFEVREYRHRSMRALPLLLKRSDLLAQGNPIQRASMLHRQTTG